jgi:hypothetical protein
MNTIERKYVMIKLGAGDWLLPHNDGRRIFRLARYVDDVDISLSARTFWAVHKFPGTPQQLIDRPNLVQDWDGWEYVEGNLSSRAEAIQAVLRA